MFKWIIVIGIGYCALMLYEVNNGMNAHYDRAYLYLNAPSPTSYVGSITDRKNCEILAEAINQKYAGPRMICSSTLVR